MRSLVLGDDAGQLLLWPDWQAVGIQWARELRRVAAGCDVGDLHACRVVCVQTATRIIYTQLPCEKEGSYRLPGIAAAAITFLQHSQCQLCFTREASNVSCAKKYTGYVCR